jgi:tRNA (cmo5U34)-methyltransferase
MGDGMTAMKFEDQELPDLDGDYVRLAEQFIPGRLAIFAIVEASLVELLPKGPRISRRSRWCRSSAKRNC